MIRRPFVLTLSNLFKLVAFVCFVAALAVSEAWWDTGLWTSWVAAGLALYVFSDFV